MEAEVEGGFNSVTVLLLTDHLFKLVTMSLRAICRDVRFQAEEP
jgi:hypothetical protein